MSSVSQSTDPASLPLPCFSLSPFASTCEDAGPLGVHSVARASSLQKDMANVSFISLFLMFLSFVHYASVFLSLVISRVERESRRAFTMHSIEVGGASEEKSGGSGERFLPH